MQLQQCTVAVLLLRRRSRAAGAGRLVSSAQQITNAPATVPGRTRRKKAACPQQFPAGRGIPRSGSEARLAPRLIAPFRSGAVAEPSRARAEPGNGAGTETDAGRSRFCCGFVYVGSSSLPPRRESRGRRGRRRCWNGSSAPRGLLLSQSLSSQMLSHFLFFSFTPISTVASSDLLARLLRAASAHYCRARMEWPLLPVQ